MPGLALLASALVALVVSGLAAGSATAAGRPVVAVLDSGVDVRHPAFKGALWRNPAETARNGVDDDGNGHVDDVNGVDIVDGDGDPRDPNGHGTHVAGIVARGARVRIMAVRILGADCTGTSADLASGIDYAVTHGARVINLSVEGYSPDPAIEAALGRAAAAGATVVASSGNHGHDLDVEPDYPASYRTPGMLVVGAARSDGRLASWSGRGVRSVDLAAPGVLVRSALPGGRYGLYSGTSQAAAAVSRAAAIAIAARNTSAVDIHAALVGSVIGRPSLAGAVASGGVLSSRRALATLRR